MKAERCINEYTMQQLCMLNLNLIVACPPRRRSGYPFQSFLRRPTKKDFHYYPSRTGFKSSLLHTVSHQKRVTNVLIILSQNFAAAGKRIFTTHLHRDGHDFAFRLVSHLFEVANRVKETTGLINSVSIFLPEAN